MAAISDRGHGEIFRHLAPDRLHIEQTADGPEVFSPKRKDGALDLPIGVFEIVRYVFSAGAIVRHRAPYSAGGAKGFRIGLEPLAGDRHRIVAPVGKEVTKPDCLASV